MRTLIPCLALVVLGGSRLSAATPDATGIEFFEKKIRPVLVEHCYSCHSAQAKKHKGGLLLDSRAGLRTGGNSGPAVVPGDPEGSLLIKALRYSGDKLKMPPRGKLPDALIADFAAWIKRGAPDPREQGAPATTATAWEELLKNRRGWWSLQPVHKPLAPAVKHTAWSDHPVDRFLLARLEAANLEPAEPADRRTLIRRLGLVLTGLPPTAEEVEAFVRDVSPRAVERLVDRLLASPHFGERWARHWLDVVRFSETHGNEWNYEVHHAWRYRDYLIRAFNQDVPYDQLVREHIAGDLLPPHPTLSPAAGGEGNKGTLAPAGAEGRVRGARWNRAENFNESVIGTAFYRFGEVNHDDCITLRSIGFDLADNQIDTLSKAFQATTVACARCHDHKLDAVSTKDYHAVLGILRSSRQVSHTLDGPEVNAAPMQQLRQVKAEIRQELGEVWLREARDVGRYLLAAQARRAGRADAGERARGLDAGRLDKWTTALQDNKAPPEDPLSAWRSLASVEPTAFAAAWRTLAERQALEEREREDFNRKHFVTYADFRAGTAGWQVGGHGLRRRPTHSGDFTLASDGDALLRAVLPAGCFTHSLSERLNGTLRSPVLPQGIKHISFQVMGRRSSAVRLVSNNCQLNYKNYRALTSDEPRWVTFTPPPDSDAVRVYAELMTMLDNPKFPDQLSALGGDRQNYRLPWDEATADPRSYFGITRVVLHDEPAPPRPEMSHLRPLFTAIGPSDASPQSLAGRYAAVVESAVRAWLADRATDDDVRWLDSLLQRGLLGNRITLTPRLEGLAARYRATEKELALPRIVPGVADCGPGFDQPILVRGDCQRPGEVVRRHYVEVLSRPGERFQTAGSGRLELAEEIARADNPLTARVMVNRIWHHLFGAGLVRTVDDFGRVGELPSHPELLDYLAAGFVENTWSIKRLIRSLVLTRAFQLASRLAPAARAIDPQNRLLQHYPVRRMEAEAIRDSILTASGRLDRTLYGPSIQPYRDKANPDRRLFPGPLDGHGRRSIYIKNNLMEAPQFLAAFNFPGGKVTQGRRDMTNVPAQALALLNDPFVLQQAGVWADQLLARPDASVAARVEHMFQVALGRPPERDERTRFEDAVREFAQLYQVAPEEILKSPAIWKDVAHTIFNMKEFIYIR